MALSSKLTSIKIRANQDNALNVLDWVYTLTISSMQSDIGQVNFTSAYDEALDGTLRSNLRGFRGMSATISTLPTGSLSRFS